MAKLRGIAMPPAFLRPSWLVALALGAQAADAGEAAARRVIGFSADGGKFALEEFGAADSGMGAGAIHSYIYFVDTAKNEVLDESVNATLNQGGAALLGALRKLSAEAASATVQTDKIALGGRLLGADASSRAGETFTYLDVWPVEKAAKASLAVQAREIGGKAQLVVEYDAPPRHDENESASDKSPNFSLSLVKPDGKRIALTGPIVDPHVEDRGAFYKYAIAEAYLLPRKDKPPVIAAIVETFTLGGEGVSRNFIPVAIVLPAP
jgi:predicted secreted protein